jgi:hypothetical protein
MPCGDRLVVTVVVIQENNILFYWALLYMKVDLTSIVVVCQLPSHPHSGANALSHPPQIDHQQFFNHLQKHLIRPNQLENGFLDHRFHLLSRRLGYSSLIVLQFVKAESRFPPPKMKGAYKGAFHSAPIDLDSALQHTKNYTCSLKLGWQI